MMILPYRRFHKNNDDILKRSSLLRNLVWGLLEDCLQESRKKNIAKIETMTKVKSKLVNVHNYP